MGTRAVIFASACLSLWFTGTCPAQPPANDGSEEQWIQRTIAAWKAQHSEIVTGHFKIQLHRYFREPNQPGIGREAFQRVANGLLEARAMPQDWLKSLPVSPFVLDESIEIFVEGEKKRNNRQDQQVVFDGTREIRYVKTNRQIDIHPGKSRVEIFDLHTVRFVPYMTEQTADRALYTASRLGKYRLALQRKNAEFIVREADGFVTRATFRVPNTQTIDREIYQLFPEEFPGKIVLPRVTMNVSYKDDNILLLSVYQLLEAKLNQELPPDTFVMGAPRNVRVYDRDSKDGKNQYTRTTKAEKDVLKLELPYSAPAPTNPNLVQSHASVSLGTWLAILAISAALGWFFWRRYRQKSH